MHIPLERTCRLERRQMHLRAIVTARKRINRFLYKQCFAMGVGTLAIPFIQHRTWRGLFVAVLCTAWAAGCYLQIRWWQRVLRAHDFGRSDFRDADQGTE